ncbi:unnamed protein product [Clonostachys solani]|uniref:AAA+ ATPase domain-containing protein n=1 Tax=Clonostachys solani TaxID=160281 RepID=A0A9N9Z0C7_9HYPO|nr:unnamed protein product [Clonostachys solani]
MSFFGRPPIDEAPETSQVLIQTLYEAPQTCHCCRNWSVDPGASLEEENKALVARMRKNYSEGRTMSLDSVVVQNASLKQTVREVFEGYKGMRPSMKKFVFKAPFHPFYFRWARFTEILERQQRSPQPAPATYSQLLHDLLLEELQKDMTEVELLLASKSITYRRLWAIFQPGERAVSTKDGVHEFFVINYCEYKESHMEIHAKYVDWDGTSFGYANKTLRVDKFAGTRHIAELEVFPASFHPLKKELELQAIARGKKFQTLGLGHQHKAYDGLVKYTVGRRKVTKSMKGRIVLDKVAYMRETRKDTELVALTAGAIMPDIDVGDYEHIRPDPISAQTMINALEGDIQFDKVASKIKARRSLNRKSQDLTDDQLMLCSATVHGFFLELNRWAKFEVESVKDIEWDDEVFSTLLLPEGYKTLMLSFVHGQEGNMPQTKELEQSRGLGLNILLAGRPGTGKSFTVEAVAEHTRRPLYRLSAAELGENARAVEERLQMVLELSEKWDAILLLEDCDGFLQDRAIVGVALRLFDFYKGLMFLTSNHPEAIDSAMQSRINLRLNYPDLNASFRENIWKQLIWSLGQANTLSNDDFAKLRAIELNGRQIKNVAKFAVLFATREREAFCMQHIELVLEATHNGLSS